MNRSAVRIRAAIAMTLLGASAGASAQASSSASSYSMYGRVDLNLTKLSRSGWSMDQTSTSRLGFRGSEDLGGGMFAIFQLEARINPDVGTSESPRFWGRESWVGLRGNSLGTFRMGRSLSPSQRIASQYDPHGTDGIGSFGSGGLLIGHPGATFARFDNGIYYETPNWSGITAFGAVSLDENRTNTIDERFHSLRVRYQSGPVDASIGYGKLSEGNEVTSFGLAWKFGDIRPMVQLHTGERAARKRRTMLVGTTAVLGSGELRAAISKQDDRGASPQTDRTLAAVGYDYPLSKRTWLYGTVIRDTTSVTGRASTKVSGTEFGLRHLF